MPAHVRSEEIDVPASLVSELIARYILCTICADEKRAKKTQSAIETNLNHSQPR